MLADNARRFGLLVATTFAGIFAIPSCGTTAMKTIDAKGSDDAGVVTADTGADTAVLGRDSASGASVLASGQGQPCQILAIAGTLYWTDYSSGALMALGPAGGEPTRLLSLKIACSIAADSTNLYVTGMDSTDRNSVMQVPLAGGTTKELYHSQTTSVTLHGGALACDGTYVYWAQGPYIRKIAIADGTATNLVTSGVPCVLAIDDTNVYYTDDIAVAVMVVPKSGGAAVTLFQGQIGAYGIAVNSGYVIFANYDQKSVMRVPFAGGTAETLASGVLTVTSFAIGAANLYWTDQLANTVSKVTLAGGVPTTIAEHQSQPVSVAVDSTNVYWANQGSIGKATGSIAMASK